MVNRVIAIGRLGKDPDPFHGQTFMSVSFSIACSEKYKDKSGAQQEKTEWINCKAFGKLAEICSTYLQKGALVYIEGKLQTNSWEGDDGQKKYKTEVLINEMKMLSPKSENAGAGTPQNFDSQEEIPF